MKCINQARKVCENVLGSLILPLSTIFLLDLVQYFLFIIHRLFLMVHIQAVERYQHKKKYIRSACLYLISSVVFEPTLKHETTAKPTAIFAYEINVSVMTISLWPIDASKRYTGNQLFAK